MQVLDVLWMQHLENMQQSTRGHPLAQYCVSANPLVEYRVESQRADLTHLQRTLQEEVLRVIFRLQKRLVNADKVEDDTYDSDLTKAAASAVEKGVNEAGLPSTRGGLTKVTLKSVKREKTQSEKNHERRVAQKKKKQQRQNRKNGRRLSNSAKCSTVIRHCSLIQFQLLQ